MDVRHQRNSGADRGSKETNPSRGVGLGELSVGGSNTGGLGKEVLMHLLPVPGSLR
jgi:hypothetical protein